MESALQTHKRKIYISTLTAIALLLTFLANFLFFFAGMIFHNEFCILNTRSEFVHYTNLQSRLKLGIEARGWQSVDIKSRFAYTLKGTYIPNPVPTNKTVICLHGMAATQTMGLHYEELYLSRGYNLLIYDSRGHGVSGGSGTTWGYYERYDLDQWIDWLLAKNSQEIIGVHGVSMGAATALMHASLNETNKRVRFYIADSAYSDLNQLITHKIFTFTKVQHPFWIYIFTKYVSIIAYLQSGFSYEDISPIKGMANVTTPILYLHGEADPIIPVEMSQELYSVTKGYCELKTFANISHGRAAIDRKTEYRKSVESFLNRIELR